METEAELRGSYRAGDQNLFASGSALQKYGCGLVALGDLLRYLEAQRGEGTGKAETASYESEIKALNRGVSRVAGALGVGGFRLAAALNRRAAERCWGVRAVWGFRRDELLPGIRGMLGRDFPVVLSVGPGFSDRSGRAGILLRDLEGKPAARAVSHYLTVTALCAERGKRYFRVCSWGERFLMDADEYLERRTRGVPLLGECFSNALRIEERGAGARFGR